MEEIPDKEWVVVEDQVDDNPLNESIEPQELCESGKVPEPASDPLNWIPKVYLILASIVLALVIVEIIKTACNMILYLQPKYMHFGLNWHFSNT